jgi:hypothetical protein
VAVLREARDPACQRDRPVSQAARAVDAPRRRCAADAPRQSRLGKAVVPVSQRAWFKFEDATEKRIDRRASCVIARAENSGLVSPGSRAIARCVSRCIARSISRTMGVHPLEGPRPRRFKTMQRYESAAAETTASNSRELAAVPHRVGELRHDPLAIARQDALQLARSLPKRSAIKG